MVYLEIKDYLDSKFVNQAKLAKKIPQVYKDKPVSRAIFCLMTNGRRHWFPHQIDALCKALNVDRNEIYDAGLVK